MRTVLGVLPRGGSSCSSDQNSWPLSPQGNEVDCTICASTKVFLSRISTTPNLQPSVYQRVSAATHSSGATSTLALSLRQLLVCVVKGMYLAGISNDFTFRTGAGVTIIALIAFSPFSFAGKASLFSQRNAGTGPKPKAR